MDGQDVLNFWFKEVKMTQWLLKDQVFDNEIRRKFGECHHQASQGECLGWRKILRTV